MKQKILIVDDDPDVLNVLGEVFSESGFAVIALDSGDKVEATLKKDNPDLVLLDVNLPSIDGDELTEKLKAKNYQVPIILISGDDQLAYKARKSGADGYFQKPFDVDSLLLKAAQFLD